MDVLTAHLADMMWLILLLAIPFIAVIFVLNASVGFLQSVLGVPDVQIAAGPRILASVILLGAFGGWYANELLDYARDMLQLIGQIRL